METQNTRPTGTDSARIVVLIETQSKHGQGIAGDPHRIVRQYWTPQGELKAEFDPVKGDLHYEIPADV